MGAIYENFTSFNNSPRHLIASYEFDEFEFPKAGQYAFVVGLEAKFVFDDLKSYLTKQSDLLGEGIIETDEKGRIFVKREVGREYFKIVDNTVVVIFVYDNGDSIIDSTEDNIIESFNPQSPIKLSDENYLLYEFFVKNRGAGKEYDYWLLNKNTGQATNLSARLKALKDFQKKYKEQASDPFLDLKYATNLDAWEQDNPIFQVADGWSILEGKWVYDLETEEFRLVTP